MSKTALVIPDKETEQIETHLVARNTQEMDAARTQLKEWLTAKIRTVKHEADELAEARDVAIKQKWGNAALKRHADMAVKRLTFYKKVRSAVDAGYTIIPNFPVDLFAIRVNKLKPPATTYSKDTEYDSFGVKTVPAKQLPEGEGRYVDDSPRGQHRERDLFKDDHTKFTRFYFDITAYGEVEFPIACARPIVMAATAEAMALTVFDAIGICPSRGIREDPLIIGQIHRLRSGYGGPQIISFLIAWHVDLKTL